jgi:hypothetical protein
VSDAAGEHHETFELSFDWLRAVRGSGNLDRSDGPGRFRGRRRFCRLNTDADTTLDMREVKGVIGEKEFAAADADHDDTLSKTEYLALVQKLFKRADVAQDGTLDAKELFSKPRRMLKRLID